jgi:Uma2 family endonuclease
MSTAAEPKLMTGEEFMAADLGEGRFELVRGKVVELPPTMPRHGLVCGRIGFVLESFGRQTGYGYCLFGSGIATERGPDSVRGPDVCFYSQARWPRSEVGYSLPPVPPALVVEVASPRDRPGHLLSKVAEYLEAGVPLVLVVYPKPRNVAIFRPEEELPIILREGEFLENFPELPGFRCPVSDLFV